MNEAPNHLPPKNAQKLLQFFVDDQWWDELAGDLEEQFEDNVNQRSLLRAKFIYWLEVIRLLRPHIFKKNKRYNKIMMTRNYLKISYRNLTKNKVYAVINILGLSIGIASVMLIAIYVNYETSYDEFYEDSDRIHRIALERVYPGRVRMFGTSSIMLAPTLRENYPQVEAVTRFHRLFFNNEVPITLPDNEKSFIETRFMYADSLFFKVFTHEFIVGNEETALDKATNVVLTESTAIRYFGTTDALDKIINLNSGTRRVSGVIKDLPPNSHMHFDLLGSTVSLPFLNNAIQQRSWFNPWVYTYVKLKEGINPDAFESELDPLVDTMGMQTLHRIWVVTGRKRGMASITFFSPSKAST